ncbi:isoprenoid synthase domain-containing protein [Flammula alnicola]|nr:isoprenoid synthase domain-containing protein [Flammula alnicola]
MAPVLSKIVDTSLVPSYFSYLPVRMHKDVEAIDAATWDAIETCAPPGSKERIQAVYRHTNPYGNPYALCHGECDITKLEYFVKVVEMIWIDDDVTEELPHAEALYEHEVLRHGLHREFDDNTTQARPSALKRRTCALPARACSRSTPRHPGTACHARQIPKEYDNSETDFMTIEEYLPYRFPMRGTGSALTLRDGRWISTYGRRNPGQKFQSTDRVRNAVPLLMRQYSLPENQARLLLKGIIVDEEERAKKLCMKLESRPDLSSELKRYIEALELYSGGNCYWSATCPRYNKPQEEKGKVESHM